MKKKKKTYSHQTVCYVMKIMMKMFEYDGNYLRGWRDELSFWDFIK